MSSHAKGASLNKRGLTLEASISRVNQTPGASAGWTPSKSSCNLRLRFTWCVCSVQKVLKQTDVHRRVKPKGKMSCQIKLSSEPLATIKSPDSQTASHLKSGGSKSRHIKRKTRGAHVAISGRGREDQSKVKARSAGWERPRPTAANTGQVPTGTRSIPTGLSNIDRNTHPNPSGLTSSEWSPRRAVRASGYGLCGDCKYISPQRKTLGKQGQKSGSPGPAQSTVEIKILEENRVPEASQKIIVWIDQYPKVMLCDIAKKCDGFSEDCAYILPEVLKTKAVHCFKQEMRAGFELGPGCLGHNKHKSEEDVLAKNKFCPSVQCQSLTEHERNLKERTDTQMLSSHTTCRFLKSWTSEDSTTCSASFLLGKRAQKGECRTGMWDRDVGEDPGSGSRITGAEIRRDKRIKLGDSVKDGVLQSTSDLQSIICKNPAKSDSRDKEKTRSHSCSEDAFGGSSIFGSAVKENSVHEKPCGERGSPTKTDSAQMSPELFCQSNEVDTDELESFTCQRVRPYFRKRFSCARTYMSWPFLNSDWTITAHAATTACPAEPVDPSDNGDSPIKQNEPSSPSLFPNAPTGPSSNTTHQLSHQNDKKREEGVESILKERTGKINGNLSWCSPDNTDMEFAPCLTEAEESLAGPPSFTTDLPSPNQHGRGPSTDTTPASSSSFPVNGPRTNSSISTPSPSALGLSDWETATTLSSMSSPFVHGGLSSLSATLSSLPPSSLLPRKVKSAELADASSPICRIKAVGKPLLYCETRMTSSPLASPHNSDSFQSCESSLLLPQDKQESDEELLTGRCPPKLEPYYNTSPINCYLVKKRLLHDILTENCVETDFMLPPMLSPVTSPQGRSWTSFPPQSPGCSDEEEVEEEINKHKMLPGYQVPQIVNNNHENSKDYLEYGIEELEEDLTTLRKLQSSPSSDEDVDDGDEEKSQDETDCEDDVEQGNKKCQRLPSDPKIKATLTSGVLTSSDEDVGVAFTEGPLCFTRAEGSSPSEIAGSERDQTKAGDTHQGILNEFSAYERDILLVDVIQDDPELFENLPKESLLKLGPNRVIEAPKTRPIGVVKKLFSRIDGASSGSEQRSTPVNIDFHCDSPDITEESKDRPWRPQCSSTSSKLQSSTRPAAENQTVNMNQPDANNNRVNEGPERNQPIKTVNSLHNHILPLMNIKNGPWITTPANTAEFKRQKSNAYCRQYFSESLSCGFKMCRFQHVPVEGDEKFCVDTVTRFAKNPMCLQKAGAVFTGYYHNNPPGVYFSMPVLLSLLWALLKAGMVSNVFSVLSVSLAHKIEPGHEFLLALFNFVREKGLMGLVPELMQLTFKMASAGLVLSLDCLDCVKNTPEVHQINSVSKLTSSAPFPEYLNLAHSVVEIELCTKQEDWRRMGGAFRSICQSSQYPNQLEQISGRIAIALLSESKDKLYLPFAAFAETVCQNEGEDSLVRSFLGRIGVSLMLRYHKTHQWAKGRRVVEVLSVSKISYSTLKGLFGNEDRASRCYLVTVATELFLLSGSVEGALNTLRENKWFLSSCSWPCESADLEGRTRVLIRLAEKTSHRDTLEVLCNLPGLKEPNNLVNISRYCPLFNSHLQVCVDRQTLPVASDTVDFMLSRNLAVDQAVLQILLHKLGKQNLWLRAREVFRHSLSVGYYPGVSAPPGFMTLIVPCRLGEVELALAFEMFITVNATVIFHVSETTTCCLSITLKRTQSCESEYLSAGSRLLSAACIPQPKLMIHYKAVNSSQEQVFILNVSSARCWLRHNHLWANEVWPH